MKQNKNRSHHLWQYQWKYRTRLGDGAKSTRRTRTFGDKKTSGEQPTDDIFQTDYTILASSTYGHGVLQDHFIPYAQKLEHLDFSGQCFAVIGLGDRNMTDSTILNPPIF